MENRFTEKVERLKKEAEEDEKYRTYRDSALLYLAQKKRNEACEVLVEAFKQNNTVYSPIDDKAPEIWVYEKGIFIPNGKTKILEFCRKLLDDAYTTSIGNQVSERIRLDTLIQQDEFFNQNNKEEIVLQNGILNIHTKKLNPHTPTKIFFSKIPVKYDPKKECPTIIEHFNTVLENGKEDTMVIQELIGYMLYKDYPFEKAFMFIGSGRNGKSVSMDLLKRFLGPENCTNVSLHQIEEDQYALSQLHKKLVNMCMEVKASALTSTSKFKSLTGRDLLSANRKYLSHLYFVNYAKQVFACNQLPRTYDDTIAFYSRWIILNFPYTFYDGQEYETKKNNPHVKKANRDIVEFLSTEEELSGLLNWALKGLHRLLEQKGFSHSQTTDAVRNSWIRKSDSFKAFCLDCLEEDFDNTETKEEVSRKYIDYCKANRAKIMHAKHIKIVLLELFGAYEKRITTEAGDRVLVWHGIKFKEVSNGNPQQKLAGMSGVPGGTPPYTEKKIIGIGIEPSGFPANPGRNTQKLIKSVPKLAFFFSNGSEITINHSELSGVDFS